MSFSSFSTTRGTLLALTLLGLAVLPQTVRAQSLTTLFASNNGNNFGGGVFFDLNANTPVTISRLDLNVDTVNAGALVAVGATVNIEVWTRTGTVVGAETSSAGWTQIATGTGKAAATNSPTPITLTSLTSLLIGPGVTGVAIRNVDFSQQYTNGTGANETYSNADMTVTGRSATASTFLTAGTVRTPRVWNGTIAYTLGTAPEPGTLALVALGMVGGLVTRRRRK